MGINYLENQFLNNTLFKREECLEINYLPTHIFHREDELILLSKFFIQLIENPFSISRKVLVKGAIGIGKTLITKTFGNMLLKSAKKRHINIHYIHINCRIERTTYNILIRILRSLNYSIPKRGFSPQEVFSTLHEYLQKENIYLLLVLDELNYLNFKNFDLIYSLTRLNEISENQKNYLSLISIVRDITLLRNLDDSTLSSLQGTVLSMKKYSLNQINEILKQRIDLSLKPRTFHQNLINYVAESIVSSGDIRTGLNIIRNSVKIAESRSKTFVTLEDIHDSMKSILPSLHDNAINILNPHQTLLLHALTTSILENSNSKVSMKEINEYYLKICTKFNFKPRKNTQLWENLQILKNYDLIKIENQSKDIRGRKSFFRINDLPIELLQDLLNERLIHINGRNYY